MGSRERKGEERGVEGVDYVTVTVHEPSMTADNLGLKTWASSFMLARKLAMLRLTPGMKALELGSGTGLVGIACAAVLGAKVTLTDLPEIVPNLQYNVDKSSHLSRAGLMQVKVLDWTCPPVPESEEEKFPLVLAADALYSSAHPELVLGMLELYLKKEDGARVLVEFPLKERFEDERERFWNGMKSRGFVLVDGGVDTMIGGDAGRVRCWWGLYRWADEHCIVAQALV